MNEIWTVIKSEPIPFITLVVAVCGILFYYWQVRAMRKASELASIQKILEYVDDIDLRRARHFTYRYPHYFSSLAEAQFSWETLDALNTKIKKESEQEVSLEKIEVWLNALNNIAFMVRKNFAPGAIIEDHLKNTYLHCWEVLRPYIYFRRNKSSGTGNPDPPPASEHLMSYVNIESTYGKHFVWVMKQIEKGKFGRNDQATQDVFTAHPLS